MNIKMKTFNHKNNQSNYEPRRDLNRRTWNNRRFHCSQNINSSLNINFFIKEPLIQDYVKFNLKPVLLGFFILINSCSTSSNEALKHSQLICYFIKSYKNNNGELLALKGKLEFTINRNCNKSRFIKPNRCIKEAQLFQIGMLDDQGELETTLTDPDYLQKSLYSAPLEASNKFRILHTKEIDIYNLSLSNKSDRGNEEKLKARTVATKVNKAEGLYFDFDLNISFTAKDENREYYSESIPIPLRAGFFTNYKNIVFKSRTDNMYGMISKPKTREFITTSSCYFKDVENSKWIPSYEWDIENDIPKEMVEAGKTFKTIKTPKEVEFANVLIIPKYIYDFLYEMDHVLKKSFVKDEPLAIDLKEEDKVLLYYGSREFSIMNKDMVYKMKGDRDYYEKIQYKNKVCFFCTSDEFECNKKVHEYNNGLETWLKVGKELQSMKDMKLKR